MDVVISAASIVLILLSLTGTLVECQKVSLTFKPSGNVKAGSTVHVVCEIPGMKPFEQIRIDRTVDGKEYEITTDDYVQNRFRNTERYHVTKWEPDKGLVELQISDVVGGDGGNIGCKHLPSRRGYANVLTVYVPPKLVTISYLDTNDKTYIAGNGDRILFTQGTRAALICTAEVDRTDTEPEVVITMGGKDMTSYFAKFVNRSGNDDDGLSGARFKVTYQMLMDSVDVSRHGKNMTCLVKTPGHPSLFTSVLIEVDSKPHLSCEEELGGRLGDAMFEISCRANMNPRPSHVTWTWNDDVRGQVKIINGNISDSFLRSRYAVSSTELSAGLYEFKLVIHKLHPADFRQYELHVTNTFGTASNYLILKEVFVTTPKRIPTTTMALQEVEEKGDFSPQARPVSASQFLQGRVTNIIGLLVLATTLYSSLS